MRYPTLTTSKTTELAEQLAAGESPSIDAHVHWAGVGEDVDLSSVRAAAEEITSEAREWSDKDRDRYEGKAAMVLYAALCDLPISVLDDRGFWRFLSLSYFWEFIAWRESEPFSKGNHLKYLNAAANTEAVLTRMYLRAQAVGGNEYEALGAVVPQGTDFWRSHVLRVRTGSAPAMTRAFAGKQAEERLMTDSLRQAARRLNRSWANVVLHIYDDEEAAQLIETIWDHER